MRSFVRHAAAAPGQPGRPAGVARAADWVRNLVAEPRVRVKVGGGRGATWRAGTARIVDADDPHERLRTIGRGGLARRLCVCTSATSDTDPLTVRVDLDPS